MKSGSKSGILPARTTHQQGTPPPQRARFELDVADLLMKRIDKLKSSGVLQIEDCAEAAKRIHELMFGKYTKEEFEAPGLAPV